MLLNSEYKMWSLEGVSFSAENGVIDISTSCYLVLKTAWLCSRGFLLADDATECSREVFDKVFVHW